MQQEILMVTTFPPRECGIATYSEDLMTALNDQFGQGWRTNVVALNEPDASYDYDERVVYQLNAHDQEACAALARWVNKRSTTALVHIQFEFGLFGGTYGSYLMALLVNLEKPFVITYHTVLPDPDRERRELVQSIARLAAQNTVMTNDSVRIMRDDYGVDPARLAMIPHGTHGTVWRNKDVLANRYRTEGRKVLSTFGLLSSNKSIETGIAAMAEIVKYHPDALYLVLGRTHPGVVAHEGERYREQLEAQVAELGLKQHVRFVNKYLDLAELLEYLQLTDLYLFTSRDPHQAVSGTFTYAMSCGCPIVATPIPHAHELLKEDTGVLLSTFQDPEELAAAAVELLDDAPRREWMGNNAYHRMCASTWENVAVTHARLYADEAPGLPLTYDPPKLILDHMHRLTTPTGMLQFARFNVPDPAHGYTLDDNARALIVTCLYREVTGRDDARELKRQYINFVVQCRQPDGRFLNYVDVDRQFTPQNDEVNLEDANARATWALGYYLQHAAKHAVPPVEHDRAQRAWAAAFPHLAGVESPRALGFAVKGLWHHGQADPTADHRALVERLADRLLGAYRAHTEPGWEWFEPYLTYANSILPEALLYAARITGHDDYRTAAMSSMRFLVKHLFVSKQQLQVVSNQGWWQKGQPRKEFGEQSIDVAYTIHTLLEFAAEPDAPAEWAELARVAFGWYMGNNRLAQCLYNPATGGCFDGLEAHGVNLKQGEESTVCYLMARLLIERNGGMIADAPATAEPGNLVPVATKERGGPASGHAE
ncbi:MAG: glycosyltransferase [Catalinimonas sp.]